MAHLSSHPRRAGGHCTCAAAASVIRPHTQPRHDKTGPSAHGSKTQSGSASDAMRAYLQLLDARVAELECVAAAAAMDGTAGQGMVEISSGIDKGYTVSATAITASELGETAVVMDVRKTC